MGIILKSDDKLAILGMAARYDASCSSSGSSRSNDGGTGNALKAGICHSWADDGRCISLLKVLQSNVCLYDCAYCINRRSNDVPRAAFSSSELADLTMEFYKRNYIEGLFLSSAVHQSPDYSMETMLQTVRLLRRKHSFFGYIHMKVMPGADPALINEAGLLADRVSANIEVPTSQGLLLLAPDKKPDYVMGSIKNISYRIRESADARKAYKKAPVYSPAGQSTQLIVGATGDTDKTIITLSENLYNKLSLKRVYYSAFIPVNKDNRLPAILKPPLKREHRLYQADWLLRFYGFTAGEILNDEHPDLEMEMDPKTSWALRNFSFFPVEINRASYEEILRIPGIGVRSAQRIIKARRQCTLKFDDLKKIGVVMKRAKYFITCAGKKFNNIIYPEAVRADLIPGSSNIKLAELKEGQLTLFQPQTRLISLEASAEM